MHGFEYEDKCCGFLDEEAVITFDAERKYVDYEYREDVSFCTHISEELIDLACRLHIPLTELTVRHVRYLPKALIGKIKSIPNLTLDKFDEFYSTEPEKLP
jgi:hypothetical protein